MSGTPDADQPPTGLGPACIGSRVVVRRVLPGLTGPSGGPAMTDVLGVMESWDATTTSVRTEDGSLVVIRRAEIVSGKPVPPRPSPRLRVSVADAEHRALGSWPPLEVERLGDWVLRASHGFSARANSALLVGHPDRPWTDALAAVAAFYRDRALPGWVQAMEGSAELTRLEGAGWHPARPGELGTAFHLAGVAQALRRAGELVRSSGEPAVQWHRSPCCSDTWLVGDDRARAHHAAAVQVLEGPDRVVFVSGPAPSSASLPAAKGRAALPADGDWVGLTDIWVAPDQRRRGLAVQVVRELLEWGAEQGATTAYLQVRQDNAAALALYQRLGFTRHHSYCYLQPPDPPD